MELVELHGTVTLDHVEPLVRYAQSAREFYEGQSARPWSEILARFEDLARARLARDGTIVIPTRSGLFVRRRPRPILRRKRLPGRPEATQKPPGFVRR